MKWKVQDKIQETPDTVTIRCKPEKRVPFKAGQFFLVYDVVKGLEECRAYSASSSPLRDYVDITVRLVAEPCFSRHLQNLPVGRELEVKGPLGDFFVEDNNNDPLVLIGAGSGIAPLRSMIQGITDLKLDRDVSVIYSAKTFDRVIFAKELMDLDKAGEIDLKITLTQERKKGCGSGRITARMLKQYVDKRAQVFLCGPPAMVRTTVRLLKEIGVSDMRIHQEKF